MARREVISNKVEKFDDQPENFRTWKVTFKSMIRDINITASEELSLLAEYTMRESNKLVQRLRNAYIENPDEGVKETWRKLCERFGSDAVITNVHLNKLNVFPKIGGKDNIKLQELGDLLLELECTKNGGGFKGLGILDEPTYLRPIVEKLPDDLQRRWQRHAYRYKVNNTVDYPPFAVLSEFVQDIAQERNDPFLTLETADEETVHPTRAVNRQNSRTTRQGVTTIKTDMTDSSSAVEHPSSAPEEPKRWCFIHKRPHPLTKCRVFRAKPLEERRNLLKRERVCFRCAATRGHIARDCEESIHCDECQSEDHITALHSEPYATQQKNGEEPKASDKQNQELINVTTTCTEVCKNRKGARSCCKICPAYVYHTSHLENKIKGYVLIDDQSNHSLAKSKVFNALGVKGEATAYTLKTCTGVSHTKGRRANGLILESLNGSSKHSLPTITECDAIPDSKEEIPTPDVAQAYAHLCSIANKIPEFDADTEVLLLIGRDVPAIHKVRESRNGPRNAPWAQRLDLGLLDHGHAEVVPLDEVATTKPGWYLPHFGVYNPQKPNKVCVVYDAAAECGGVSLNSLLLPGPDLTNSLIGILLRFQPCYIVTWYQDNNPGKDIVEYRMKVHIFGSTSSPAVATYGLRKTAEVEKANFGPDAADLVNRNFYVDDALKSVPTVEDAVDLLHRTQSMLSTANLRLHKIASNRQEVMEAFPSEDQASDLRDLDLSKDAVPVQRSLGVSWDLKTDDFTFKVSTEVEENPFTRRGVLSVVNSLYDPLGLVAPVVIRGKAFLRAMTSNLKPQDWDEPLPKEYKKAWEAWRSSLDGLTDLKVQRSYTSKALTTATRKEIHTFGDASSDSIAAVSYLRVMWPNGHVDVSFILGKAKLAPTRATTIPRLELCAAVLATEITLLITKELDVCPDSVTYYTETAESSLAT
ncbi:hypothetical protein QZH41_001160 [Actinostola sp. cb2023]|nr:hypothetical protein QZH41_001160 [Actinostola sp. cb2023]